MEKKFKFTENPNFAKTVYGVVIAVLCITAIIIGIVAANQKQEDELPEEPPVVDDGGDNTDDGTNNGNNGDGGTNNEKPEKLTFISPVSGSVVKSHSMTEPVYSTTLEEWRIHTGIDISTTESAPVFAAADGEVSAIYNHALLGHTVEITHEGGTKTLYCNLTSDDSYVAIGDTVEVGERIGTVGDTSLSELAEETHLHFAVIEGGVSVDPIGIISEEAKEASLGIKTEE